MTLREVDGGAPRRRSSLLLLCVQELYTEAKFLAKYTVILRIQLASEVIFIRREQGGSRV